MIPSPRVMAHMVRGPHALFHRLWNVPWYRDTLTEWVDSLALPPGATVVEVGSAAGDLTGWMVDRGWTATGMDRSPAAVDAARRAHPRATFIEADAELLAVPRAAANAVIGASIVNVVPRPDRLAAQARQALVPGGTASFLFPAEGFTDDDARRLIAERKLRGFAASALRTWHASARKMRPEHVAQLLDHAGLTNATSSVVLGGMVGIATARR